MGIFDWLRKQPRAEQDASPEAPVAIPAAGSTPRLPTPLSDLMTRVLQEKSNDAWRAFCAAFLRSHVGVIATEFPVAAGSEAAPGAGPRRSPVAGWDVDTAPRVGFGRAETPDGRVMILACADREAFAQNFHDRFNRDVLGMDLAEVALVVEGCDGILVNSAASFDSLALSRARLSRLVVNPG